MKKKLCSICKKVAATGIVVLEHRQVCMCDKCYTGWYKLRDRVVTKAFNKYCPAPLVEEGATK